MGFIENLKQRLDVELQARQQRDESLGLARKVEETACKQREANETEIITQRRLQAENVLRESGLGTLLDQLAETIKLDPSKVGSSKLHLWPIEVPQMPPDFGEWPLGDAYAIRQSREEKGVISAIRSHNQDSGNGSVCEAVSWWDGEGKVVKDYSSREAIGSGQGINRIVHQYYKYIGVVADPNGDITFYSKNRKTVSRSAWQDRKDILESTLGEAYEKPGIYIIEEQHWTHGPRSAGTG